MAVQSSPINVTCTAKDNSGNVAVDTFKIIVIRVPAPILQCPSSTERPIKLTKGTTTTVDYVITSSTKDPIVCNPTSPVTVRSLLPIPDEAWCIQCLVSAVCTPVTRRSHCMCCSLTPSPACSVPWLTE
jgi:hypothetical protein